MRIFELTLRKRFLAAMWPVVLVASASAQEVELAGFTLQKTNGNISVKGGPIPICDGEFPGSRMCTSEEVLDFSSLAEAPFAWVRPSVVGFSIAVDSADGVVERALDISGVAASPDNLDCSQWRSALSSSTGLALAAAGRTLSTTICTAELSIACCRSIAPAGPSSNPPGRSR